MPDATKTLSHARPPHQEQSTDSQWSVAFIGLVLFMLFYYLSPEDYIPGLQGAGLNKIAGAIALIAVVIKNVGQGRPWMDFSRESTLLLIFIAVLAIGIPFSYWPGGSWTIFTEKMLKTVLFVLLLTNIITSVRQLKTLVHVIVACAIIIALVSINHYFTGMVDRWGRLIGYGEKEYSNPNDLALGLLTIIPLTFLLILEARTIFRRCIYAGAIVLMILAILFSMSRTGMIGLVFLGGVWLLAIGRKNFAKAVAIIVVMTTVLFAAASTFPVFVDRFASIFDESSKDDLGSRAARLEHMLDGAMIMVENPVFGVGMGQSMEAVYRRHGSRGAHWEQIHNVYLQVGAEAGIIALLLFVGMIYSESARLRTAEMDLRQRADLSMVKRLQCMRVAILTFVICANFSPVAYNWFFYILLGLSGALLKLVVPPHAVAKAFDSKSSSEVGLKLSALRT